MSDLELLLEKVRTAEVGSRELDAEIFNAVVGVDAHDAKRWYGGGIESHVTGSIVAIVALIERELPGLVIKATKIGDGSGHWQVQEAWMGDIEVVDDFSPMETRPGALAFAEVLLSALIAQSQTGPGETGNE